MLETTPLPRDMPLRRIAFWRPLPFGDFLVSIPALRALREAYPGTTIDYIGLPATAEVASRYPQYIDNYVTFPGIPGMTEEDWTAHSVTTFLQDMQQREYDLLIQAHGNGRISNSFAALCGAKYTTGFTSIHSFTPSEWFMKYPENEHEIVRILRLLERLGVPVNGNHMEFPIRAEDQSELMTIPGAQKLGDRYICIHPGDISGKRWNPKQFAAVADACNALGFQVVLTGAANEVETTAKVRLHMKTEALDLAGKTTTGTLAALLHGCQAYIGNETGPSHLVVALGRPSIILHTTAHPLRWAPLNKHRHPILLATEATPKTVMATLGGLLRHHI